MLIFAEKGNNSRKIKVFTGRVNIKFNSSKTLAQLNDYGVFHLSSLLLCCSSQVSDDINSPHQIAKDLLKVSPEPVLMIFYPPIVMSDQPGGSAALDELQ